MCNANECLKSNVSIEQCISYILSSLSLRIRKYKVIHKITKHIFSSTIRSIKT